LKKREYFPERDQNYKVKQEKIMNAPLQKRPYKNILILAAIFSCFLTLSSCSSSGKSSASNFKEDDDRKSAFSFTTYEDGHTIHWKVFFNEDTIYAVYRNKHRVPDNEITRYEDLIYDKMDNLYNSRYEQNSFNDKDFDIHIDMSALNENLQKLSEELSKQNIHIDFDDEQFERDMQKLGKELEKLKDLDIEINFDPETFKENMKELERNLKHMRINENDLHFDKEEFNTRMKEFSEKMRNAQYTMKENLKKNMEVFHRNMSNFNFNLHGLKTNLNNVKTRLRDLDAFFKEMKSELVKDGIIKSADEYIEIHFTQDQLEINDVVLPAELFEKYKALYKKQFGTEMKEDINFNIH
jgi:predicted  nucleic acid-binding Zn-ribbon protein